MYDQNPYQNKYRRVYMLIIQKPVSSFARVPNGVFFDNLLSHGSKVLYGIFCSLKPGQNYTDNYLKKVLNVSGPTLTRYKKELKDRDLLIVVQVSKGVYFTFVGLPNYPASRLYAEYLSTQRKLEEGTYLD